MSFHCFADVVNPDVSDARTQAEGRQDRTSSRDGWSRLVNTAVDRGELGQLRPSVTENLDHDVYDFFLNYVCF